MKKITPALLAVAPFFALAPAAHAIVLDDFGDAAGLAGGTLATPPNTTGAMLGVSNLGIARIVSAATTPIGGGLTVEIDDGLSDGFYSHSGDSLVDSASTVSYTLPAITDLSTDGTDFYNAFRVEIFATDLDATISITAGGITQDVAITGLGDKDFLFSSFAGIDFSTLTGDIILGVSGNTVDIVIDSFSVVCSANTANGISSGNAPQSSCAPAVVSEPGSVSLLGFALLGLGIAARRRRA